MKVQIHDAPGLARLRAWNGILTAALILDVLVLFADRSAHRRIFEGELGIVELGTVVALAGATLAAARQANVAHGRARTFFLLLALGCLYWAGEEISWGQTFFHWATPGAYALGNYQGETNLHNERGIVGTLLNVAPRFALLVVMVITVLLPAPWMRRLRERIAPAWRAPWSWCVAPAALAIASAILNKARPLGYREFGENQELYIALFLLAYALAWGRRRKRAPTP